MKLWLRLAVAWIARNKLLSAVTFVFGLIALGALLLVSQAMAALPAMPPRSLLQVAVFIATATLPQLWIEPIAMIAERLAPELKDAAITRWFKNTGAFVGVFERPLLLGSLVAGFPQFVGVWLVFKGIAGYRLGLQKPEVTERRLFTLFILNNAMSLSGVGLGWTVWLLLDLPTR